MGQTLDKPRVVEAQVNYALDTGQVETFHANDQSLDTVHRDPHTVEITDARTMAAPPRLDVNGFELFEMPSAITDWREAAVVNTVHPPEIARFIQQVTGADEVVVTGPAILRWGERSGEAGTRDNSYPARLVHSDVYFSAAEQQTREVNPHPERRVKRCAHHNIWRAFSGPPIDVPLAICDAQTVRDEDVIEASAGFDRDGQIVWRLPSMNFRFSPRHRWHYYSGMRPEDVLVFKRWDTQADKARYVPHTGFSDPTVGEDAVPRASVEMRSIAYWYD
ncbi:CmcJ/NvfI family oxidoreductase [Altericroceibacterium xinjiangense]|uniref:CmcJ/NvfI family oxidoreductase n=1 Tax=Altericroceibacterium xinjiangense TaxID=762261 RepID=UPI000F7E9FAD|nr:CmcJ/NvfI family oxidoreductase [Altericroceibacterium xinjiangense]